MKLDTAHFLAEWELHSLRLESGRKAAPDSQNKGLARRTVDLEK